MAHVSLDSNKLSRVVAIADIPLTDAATHLKILRTYSTMLCNTLPEVTRHLVSQDRNLLPFQSGHGAISNNSSCPAGFSREAKLTKHLFTDSSNTAACHPLILQFAVPSSPSHPRKRKCSLLEDGIASTVILCSASVNDLQGAASKKARLQTEYGQLNYDERTGTRDANNSSLPFQSKWEHPQTSPLGPKASKYLRQSKLYAQPPMGRKKLWEKCVINELVKDNARRVPSEQTPQWCEDLHRVELASSLHPGYACPHRCHPSDSGYDEEWEGETWSDEEWSGESETSDGETFSLDERHIK